MEFKNFLYENIFADSQMLIDETEQMIRCGIIKHNNENGLLYGTIEPEEDKYPDKILIFCHGRGSVYGSYRAVTGKSEIVNEKNSMLPCKVLIYQHYGYPHCVRPESISAIDSFDYQIRKINELIKEFTPVYVGYSLGSLNAVRYSRGVCALVAPTNFTCVTNNLLDLELLDLNKEIKANPDKQVLILGNKLDIFSGQTIWETDKLENVGFIPSKLGHVFYSFSNYKEEFCPLIELILESN